MRTSPEPSAESRGHTGRPLHDRWTALGSWLSALFGMPDYRRYLAHQVAHHPTEPVMSEKEFVRAEFERKYAGGGARCC